MSNSNHFHSSAISSNIKINMGLQSKKHFKAEIFFCQGTWGITVNSYTCLWKRPEIYLLNISWEGWEEGIRAKRDEIYFVPIVPIPSSRIRDLTLWEAKKSLKISFWEKCVIIQGSRKKLPIIQNLTQ